jgi:hypothetical protein
MDLVKKYSNKRLSTDEAAEARTAIDEQIKQLENIKYKKGEDYLLLKWGSWKSWDSQNKEIQKLMKKHNDLGLSASVMTQHSTDEQIEILCQIVDLIDGVIQNDWDGDYYTKQQAKEYLRGYSKDG